MPATSRIASSAKLDQRRRRRGSARSARSAPTRPRCAPPRAKRSRRLARLLASIAASLPASRWRWSSSCSAVSTTEVTIPGLQTTPPRRADGAVAGPLRDLAELERELRGAGERVAALVHRRRAGVRGLAAPGDPVALDAERAEHDAEREVQRLEHRALLDVQLEVGGRVLELRSARRARGRGRRRARASASGQRDRRRGRSAARSSSWSAIEPAAARGAEERAAEARALLVGPVDEPDGDRRRRPPRRSGAAPRRRRRRSGSRRASRRSAPSRCGRRSGRRARTRRAASHHWLPASSTLVLERQPVELARASQARACSQVSVHATRCAPFSSPVSSRSSRSSRDGAGGIERHRARALTRDAAGVW